jgi:hypothetical protein
MRRLPAFADLRRIVGEVAEKGGTIHFALGSGGLGGEDAIVSLAGFQLLQALAAELVSYDTPPLVTVGDPTLLPLAQDTIRLAYERRGLSDLYDPSRIRFVASSPIAYAAGVAHTLRSEGVTSSVIIGAFGTEAALIADAASRGGVSQVAAVAAPEAVAALYPATEKMAIGEEVFASGAQTSGLHRYVASLDVQDILRLVVIAAILISGFLALLRGGL